ncbi:TetR/AcrR family transcriptional regulator [Aquabacterium fontiphilum]|uniref:TetR/AcrR family transcriptional regulator n=1 Tax=Aquabacterium fontiphilum TaxID=450365 RepID=UPI002ED3CC89
MSLTPKEVRKLREAEQRRKAIIKIVRKLVRKGGVEEISLRKVAELAGYSTTVVYALFQDKATLITQAMDEDLLELTRVMREAVQAAPPGWEQVRAMARAYVAFGLRHPDEYAFVFMQRRPHAPNTSARVRHGDPEQDPYAFARQVWSGLADQGLVSATPADIDLMAQLTWEAIHGHTARQLVMGPDDVWVPMAEAQQHLDALVDVLLIGIRQRFQPLPDGS